MLKNYFKTGWRNLAKNPGYSALNIIGLAVGMTVVLLIGMWIFDEISFDRYHKKHARVGQVMTTQTFDDETSTETSIVVPLGNALRTTYTGTFKHVALSSWNAPHTLSVGDKKISQDGMWAEPALPAILSLEMQGAADALKDPSSLLLSENTAQVLFGNEDPLGKIIMVDNKASMKVAGTFKDLPENTTLHETKFLLPWSNEANALNRQTDQWTNHGSQLFVELQDNTNFEEASAAVKDLLKPHVTEWKETLLIHPMDKWHLYNEFKNGLVSGGRIQFVWFFGMIGVFVLILACINFMNLTTARSEKRAKEIGIRKAIGSLRKQLILQFLSESVLVSVLALIVALVLAYLSLPVFNSLSGKHIAMPFDNGRFWIMAIGFTGLTGVLAGSYPALYLSGFNAIKVLKGTFRTGRFSSVPRKVLVVLQFTISIAMIIGTAVVFQQIEFTKDRPVGYSRQGLITLDMNTPDLRKNYNSLRDDLLKTGLVEDMAEANSSTTEIWSNNTGVDWKGRNPDSNPLFGTIAVTHDYGKTVQWQIIDGRDFSRDFPADSGAFILNESAVKLTGIKDPVGKIMRWNNRDRVITGIAKDMVMESPYEAAQPTIFHLQYDWVNKILVRMKPGIAVKTSLDGIAKVFNKHNPSGTFEYTFADAAYGQKFAMEERIGKLAGVFAALAIFISCLGIFGLAAFVAEQRAKEISIRKVLGATGITLWRLLTKDFIALVFLSLLIAFPIIYMFMQNWLQQYEYRVPLSWSIFGIVASGTILITLITVSFQAVKAVVATPAKNLKAE